MTMTANADWPDATRAAIDTRVFEGSSPSGGHPMQALYEAIEGFRQAWETMTDVETHDAVDSVVKAWFEAERRLDDEMERLVPTDECGRWPWEPEYGEPDPNAEA